MKKNQLESSNQIVEDMKECFRSFHLPVYENKSLKDNLITFTSEIVNKLVSANVYVSYNKDEAVGINISLRFKVPSDKMGEIHQLLNLLNAMRPLCYFLVFQGHNHVLLRAVLHLPGNRLSGDKFRRMLHDLLDDSYLFFPLIEEVINGRNPEDIFDRFLDDHKQVNKTEKAVINEAGRKILTDMESVLTDLMIFPDDDDRFDDGFTVNVHLPECITFTLCMDITLDYENERIIMVLYPPFIVPDEKVTVMTELVNRINEISGAEHLFIHRDTNRIIVYKGVMTDYGVLDKQEFDKAVRGMLGHGNFAFPIIHEQLSSNETPEALITKIVNICNDHHI